MHVCTPSVHAKPPSIYACMQSVYARTAAVHAVKHLHALCQLPEERVLACMQTARLLTCTVRLQKPSVYAPFMGVNRPFMRVHCPYLLLLVSSSYYSLLVLLAARTCLRGQRR